MNNKKVILQEDSDEAAAGGEAIRKKAGYARNYLLPRKLAVEATANNIKQIEKERAALLGKEGKDRATAEAQAESLNSLQLTIQRKVGEKGTLINPVTSQDIIEALKEHGYEIDRHRVHLAGAIKKAGAYTVSLRLRRLVTADLTVLVTGENISSTHPKEEIEFCQYVDQIAAAQARTRQTQNEIERLKDETRHLLAAFRSI